MITLRKLAQLPEGTRQRKIVRVLEAVERTPAELSESYIRGLLELVANDAGIPSEVATQARVVADQPAAPDVRAINALRHAVMRALGVEPADWDLAPPPGTSDAEADEQTHGGGTISGQSESLSLREVVLFVEDIRSPFNLGSIVRTAAAFGLRRVVATPAASHFQSTRFVRSAMGAEWMVELGIAEDPPPGNGELIALETGGTPVSDFSFPLRGVLMVGSEELGLSPAALAGASRRVSVPLAGAKGSLNVGVAVGIALSWWAAASTRDSR